MGKGENAGKPACSPFLAFFSVPCYQRQIHPLNQSETLFVRSKRNWDFLYELSKVRTIKIYEKTINRKGQNARNEQFFHFL